MYRLIIVEDEQTIREALRTFVDWKKLGFNLIGAFSDGAQAFDFVKKNGVNVILTDICMPEMNGLELIKEINSLNSLVKSVILSGHDDFSYAQDALKSRVFDYILKPIDFDQIVQTFEKLKVELDNEWNGGLYRRKSDQLRREQFLSNYVKGF